MIENGFGIPGTLGGKARTGVKVHQEGPELREVFMNPFRTTGIIWNYLEI